MVSSLFVLFSSLSGNVLLVYLDYHKTNYDFSR